MDLLSIVQAIWRNKLAAIPVILITAIGVFYVLEIKHPEYQASSSIVIVSAPTPPTSEQIAANPKLGKINYNNPYANFGDLTVVADVVSSIVTSSSSQQALVKAGANPRYEVELSPDGSPILLISGFGSTAQEAIQTTNLVSSAVMTKLIQIQKNQGVNPHNMITSVELVRPQQAQLVLSGKLRTLIAVLALGVVLLFIAVSAAEALRNRRLDRSIGTDNTSTRTKENLRRPSAPAASPPGNGAGLERQRNPEGQLGQSARLPALALRRDKRLDN